VPVIFRGHLSYKIVADYLLSLVVRSHEENSKKLRIYSHSCAGGYSSQHKKTGFSRGLLMGVLASQPNSLAVGVWLVLDDQSFCEMNSPPI